MNGVERRMKDKIEELEKKANEDHLLDTEDSEEKK